MSSFKIFALKKFNINGLREKLTEIIVNYFLNKFTPFILKQKDFYYCIILVIQYKNKFLMLKKLL